MLYAIGLGVVVSIGVLALFQWAPVLTQNRSETQDLLSYRIALGSLIDYTKLGIRNRWCFSSAWLQDTNCNVTHERSVERFLLDTKAITALQAKSPPGVTWPTGTVPPPNHAFWLEHKIDQTLPIGQIGAAHPLYGIVQSLRGDQKRKVKSFRFRIDKIRHSLMPTIGKETLLKVRVSMISESGSILAFGKEEISSSVIVGMYPREIGSFALLMPGSMRLDTGANVNAGHTNFMLAVSKNNKATYPGLQFLSPVYIDDSLALAADDEDKYSPVTFADLLILGGGALIKRQKKPDSSFYEDLPFNPATAGGMSSRYFGDAPQFGGLQKGYLIDGQKDPGMPYLFNMAGPTPTVDRTLMDQCIARNSAFLDRAATDASQLLAKRTSSSSTDDDFSFRLKLTEKNEFVAQPSQSQYYRAVGAFPSWLNLSSSSLERPITGSQPLNPTMRVRLSLGTEAIDVLLEPGNDVTLQVNKGAAPALSASLIAERATKLANRDSTQAALTNFDNDHNISGSQSQIQDAIDNLSNSEKNQREDLVDARNSAANTYNKFIDDEWEPAQDQLAAQTTAYNSSDPEILLRVENVYTDGKVQPSQMQFSILTQDMAALGNRNLNATLVAYDYATDSSQTVENTLFVDPVKYGGANAAKSVTDSTREKRQTFGTVQMTLDSNTSNQNDLKLAYSLSSWKPLFNYLDTNNYDSAAAENIDETTLDEQCKNAQGEQVAFPVVDWNTSFMKSARSSWHFAANTSSPGTETENLTNTNSGGTAATSVFRIRSVMQTCNIATTASVVTGFFVCDTLNIQGPRTTPLRIIGTFIAKTLNIHESALRYGIVWSSIYHPSAVAKLRELQILSPNKPPGVDASQGGAANYPTGYSATGTSTNPGASPSNVCEDIGNYNSPLWHPYPNLWESAKVLRCNPAALRLKANPFTWTQIDPDCGLISGQPGTSCKNQVKLFNQKEMSREDQIR